MYWKWQCQRNPICTRPASDPSPAPAPDRPRTGDRDRVARCPKSREGALGRHVSSASGDTTISQAWPRTCQRGDMSSRMEKARSPQAIGLILQHSQGRTCAQSHSTWPTACVQWPTAQLQTGMRACEQAGRQAAIMCAGRLPSRGQAGGRQRALIRDATHSPVDPDLQWWQSLVGLYDVTRTQRQDQPAGMRLSGCCSMQAPKKDAPCSPECWRRQWRNRW